MNKGYIMFNHKYDTDTKTLNDVKASREIFMFNNYADQYVKLGSLREGFYVCLNLNTQRISEEQANTKVYPVINIQGLKAY